MPVIPSFWKAAIEGHSPRLAWAKALETPSDMQTKRTEGTTQVVDSLPH
jgi:hypothetical protein